MKRVVIVGGAGRMGQAMAEGLGAMEDLTVVALVDVKEPRELFGARYVPSVSDLDPSTLDVVVDFSNPEGVVASANWCGAHSCALVVGATGLDQEQMASVTAASERTGVIIASNYSVGAVLSERFAAMAAPYFSRVEIIELHHDQKRDAPSGTSLTTAQGIIDSRRRAGLAPAQDPTQRVTLEGTRGGDAGDGVRIHSVRLPGLVAHQEIIFGGPGEGLTIRHDSFDRASFVQGVALAVRAASSTARLTIGIDGLLA
ncbi:MAG: 4-hydroxy-tetrahydrodipicolinate reductase [Acidimicrobiales bacterium]